MRIPRCRGTLSSLYKQKFKNSPTEFILTAHKREESPQFMTISFKIIWIYERRAVSDLQWLRYCPVLLLMDFKSPRVHRLGMTSWHVNHRTAERKGEGSRERSSLSDEPSLSAYSVQRVGKKTPSRSSMKDSICIIPTNNEAISPRTSLFEIRNSMLTDSVVVLKAVEG